MFRDAAVARDFALGALACSRIYVSDEDRYAMQALANLLREAVAAGVLSEADFQSAEPELLEKLRRHPEWSKRWDKFRALRITCRSEKAQGDGWLKIPAKLRCIDPMVKGRGRASALFPDFGAALAEFRSMSLDYWVRGE